MGKAHFFDWKGVFRVLNSVLDTPEQNAFNALVMLADVNIPAGGYWKWRESVSKSSYIDVDTYYLWDKYYRNKPSKPDEKEPEEPTLPNADTIPKEFEMTTEVVTNITNNITNELKLEIETLFENLIGELQVDVTAPVVVLPLPLLNNLTEISRKLDVLLKRTAPDTNETVLELPVLIKVALLDVQEGIRISNIDHNRIGEKLDGLKKDTNTIKRMIGDIQ